jgi:hypothetical protein
MRELEKLKNENMELRGMILASTSSMRTTLNDPPSFAALHRSGSSQVGLRVVNHSTIDLNERSKPSLSTLNAYTQTLETQPNLVVT